MGMSDPTYVSAPHVAPAPVAASPANPSLELDEQLARQLMLEDQREQQEHRGRRRSASGQSWPRRGAGAGPNEVCFSSPGRGVVKKQGTKVYCVNRSYQNNHRASRDRDRVIACRS